MTANGVCREAFPLIVIKRNPKMFTGEIRLHAEAKSKILEEMRLHTLGEEGV